LASAAAGSYLLAIDILGVFFRRGKNRGKSPKGLVWIKMGK